jgi:mRNA interferase RelE/StbE
MYRIEYTKLALKQISGLPKAYALNVYRHIERLSENPFPHGYKKLKGSENTYRLRVGMYRILYEIHNKELVIKIITIAHRKEAYK